MYSNNKESSGKWEEAEMRSRRRRPSVANFANKTMKRSLVTGVSNIAETKSKPKKIFKSIVLILCTCGFFYQATLFMQHIRTFPSVVNIEIYIPDEYMRPAYTFCNHNGFLRSSFWTVVTDHPAGDPQIMRTKFCQKYPDRCIVPEPVEEFCKGFEHFCSTLRNKTHFLVVKDEFRDFEEQVSREELLELTHDYKSIIIDAESKDDCHDYFMDGDYDIDDENFRERFRNCTIAEQVSEPFLFRKPGGKLTICYSYYLRVESDLEPAKTPGKIRKVEQYLNEFVFNSEPDEVFVPERIAGLYFHLHTPFTLENTVKRGIFIRPKRNYFIDFYMEEDHLLPYPFQTDCINYTDLWLKNNRSGPRSQESCNIKCEMDYCFKDCNCTFPEVLYPTTGPVCTFEYDYCNKDDIILAPLDKELEECHKKCKDDCQRLRYTYSYQSRLRETNPFKSTHSKIDDAFISKVRVIPFTQEILKYIAKPQYQDLDVFSSLGGFIGAWLGVSLVAVVDMLESLVNIILYFVRKRGAVS